MHGFWPHYPSTKMLTQKHPPPLKIWFIYLISNTQTVPLKKKVKSCCCRVKSTQCGFKVRRLHNDFLARFWGCGKNRTTLYVSGVQGSEVVTWHAHQVNSCSWLGASVVICMAWFKVPCSWWCMRGV